MRRGSLRDSKRWKVSSLKQGFWLHFGLGFRGAVGLERTPKLAEEIPFGASDVVLLGGDGDAADDGVVIVVS